MSLQEPSEGSRRVALLGLLLLSLVPQATPIRLDSQESLEHPQIRTRRNQATLSKRGLEVQGAEGMSLVAQGIRPQICFSIQARKGQEPEKKGGLGTAQANPKLALKLAQPTPYRHTPQSSPLSPSCVHLP